MKGIGLLALLLLTGCGPTYEDMVYEVLAEVERSKAEEARAECCCQDMKFSSSKPATALAGSVDPIADLAAPPSVVGYSETE